MKKWLLLLTVTAVGVVLLAGQDDIRRFLRMKNM
jgi:Family of unknown function (DUF6893)